MGDGNSKNAYDLIRSYTRTEEQLQNLTGFLERVGLLTQSQIDALHRPGQSSKFRVSILLSSLRSSLLSKEIKLSTENIDDPEIRSLVKVVEHELRLLSRLDNEDTYRTLLSRNDLSNGAIHGLRSVPATLGFSYVVETDKGVYFFKYSPAFGNRYIIRADPKEVVFQNVLGENIFRELMGSVFTMRTLSPSLEDALLRRDKEDEKEDIGRINERLIIQPCYTPEFVILYEAVRPEYAGKIFGDLVGRIHSRTSGIRNSAPAIVQQHVREVRDTTLEEYVGWLTHGCWVNKTVNALRRVRNDEAVAYLDFAENWGWDNLVAHSRDYWERGAVLTTLDIRPKNTFFHPTRGTRVFDFDYFAFYDPSYHAAQTMFFAARDAVEIMGVNDHTLTTVLTRFLEGYFEALGKEKIQGFMGTPDFMQNTLRYYALASVGRYLSDYLSGQTDIGKLQTIHRTAVAMVNQGR
ncbi:hypothetical protein HYW21_05350 [Candidatus Woesearchaeota archaeon]|nr:hypothetical protein [Candidatus Woesearchaeota archaeon]